MGAITTWLVQQYNGNVQLLSQQKGSVLRSCVRNENVKGKTAYFDQLEATSAIKKVARNSDTPIVVSDNQRRQVTLLDYEWADLIDDADKLKMLADPTNPYATNAAYALGRAMDSELVTAFDATAYTGEAGGTSTTFNTTTARTTDAAVGLTLAKLLAAKKYFDNRDVDMEDRYIAVTGTQLGDLLNVSEVKSSDYNTVKALAMGEVDTFCGFKFKLTNLLGTDTNSDRKCFAWQKNGMLLALTKDVTTRITERADKSYSTQVYASCGIGATRMDEDKVFEIDCQE